MIHLRSTFLISFIRSTRLFVLGVALYSLAVAPAAGHFGEPDRSVLQQLGAQVFTELRDGKYAAVAGRVSDELAADFPSEVIQDAWERFLSRAGESIRLNRVSVNVGQRAPAGLVEVYCDASWSKVKINLQVDESGKIRAMSFEPIPRNPVVPGDLIAAAAEDFVRDVSRGDVPRVDQRLDKSAQPANDAKLIVEDWSKLTEGRGAMIRAGAFSRERVGKWEVVRVRCEFDHNVMLVKLVMNSSGHISKFLVVTGG